MKILSQGEFRDFEGFQHMGDRKTLVLKFAGTSIECTEDHKFLRDDGLWIEAQDIEAGEIFNGYELLEKTYTNEIKAVYDAINVEGTHSFYAEGVTAHNCNFLYMDEVAFVENYDEFFQSVFPTLSAGKTTKIMMTSTPKGMNHFWKTCIGAKEGKNGYGYIEVPWHRVPGRDEAWKQNQLEGMNFDAEKFEQEFNCQFLGSSGTLIAGWKLKELHEHSPIQQMNGIYQYTPPRKDRFYAIIVDVARGKGLDYSAFSVFDCTEMPYEQVCTFRDNLISPGDYASTVAQMAALYNDAFILVEINDIGEEVSNILVHEYGVEGILWTESAGRSGKRISTGFGKRSLDPGIRTTRSVKSTGCTVLKMMIEQNQLLLKDKFTIQELIRFSRKGNSYEAEAGYNDDLVMTLVLFAWFTTQAFFRDMTDIDTIQELRRKTEEEIEAQMAPFAVINDRHTDSFDSYPSSTFEKVSNF